MWRASVLTIFPDVFPGPLGASLAGKALAAGAWSLDVVDIRAFATDKHRTVDDTPAGGGPGMVMKADVLGRAIDATAADERPRLLLSPRGAPLTQARVEALAGGAGVVARLRPVRGRRRARDRGARPRRGLDRRLCAVRRRDRGHGADRRLRAAPARRHGRGGLERRGELCRRACWNIRNTPGPQLWEGRPIPEVLTVGRPRQDRRLAARRGRTADPASAGPTSGRPLSGASAAARERDDRKVTKPAR